MRLSLVTTSSASAAKSAATPTVSADAIDSVVVTRARLVLRRIRFHASEDTLDFRAAPMVLLVTPGAPLQEIDVRGVPAGTYRELEFEVHRAESSDVAGILPFDRAAFADFLAGERYSIIIEGTVYPAGGALPAPFTYRSRLDERQEFEFEPSLVVADDQGPVNVTMLIDTGKWFRSADGTAITDPRDPAQSGLIDTNLKTSIRTFEDNDRDGKDN